MIKGRWNIAFATAVLLFSDVYSSKSSFGKFKACSNADQSLTLRCFYPPCGDNLPTFNCRIYEVDGDRQILIGSSDKKMLSNSNVTHLNVSAECQLNIKNHTVIYKSQIKNYTCSLSRSTTKDEKNITVKYSGVEQPKICHADGLFPHGLSGILLWSIAMAFFQSNL